MAGKPVAAIRGNGPRQGEDQGRDPGLLIINADDWGRDYQTTERTLECILRGTVSSVSAWSSMGITTCTFARTSFLEVYCRTDRRPTKLLIPAGREELREPFLSEGCSSNAGTAPPPHRLLFLADAVRTCRSPERIFSLARRLAVEVGAHPANAEEYGFLAGGEICRLADDLPIAPGFAL